MYIGNDLRSGRSETYVFTASGSETAVTASDDSRALNYTVGWVKVWLNGILLEEGSGKDFQATTGNSITGLSALTANDVITVEAKHTFSVSDSVPATGGSFSGNVSFGDNNITNVGDIALDTITADGSSITISTDTALAAGVDIETSTTGKIKQKGSAFQSHITASLALGG